MPAVKNVTISVPGASSDDSKHKPPFVRAFSWLVNASTLLSQRHFRYNNLVLTEEDLFQASHTHYTSRSTPSDTPKHTLKYISHTYEKMFFLPRSASIK
jgi:hypothetical protein